MTTTDRIEQYFQLRGQIAARMHHFTCCETAPGSSAGVGILRHRTG